MLLSFQCNCFIEEGVIEEYESGHQRTDNCNDPHKLRSTHVSRSNSKFQGQYNMRYIKKMLNNVIDQQLVR